MTKWMPNRTQTMIGGRAPGFDDVEFSSVFKAAKDDMSIKQIRQRPIKSRLPPDQFLYLPTDFQKSSELYQIKDFETKNCRCKLEHVTVDLAKPVLKSTPTSLAKQCLQSFKYIMNCEKSMKDAEALVDLMKSQPEIVDDVFFQVLMQSTTNNENVWKLFLIVCTLFVPMKNNIRWLQAYFIRSAKDSVAELAQLCYIRLTHVTEVTKKITDIPEEALSGKLKFGVTITEQMFGQRNSHPSLPIPFMLYRLVTLMLEKNCGQVEGLFRLPGNIKLVGQLAADLNKDEDRLDEANINDLASLLKKWISDLPNPPVSFETIGALEFDAGENCFIEFTELLTRANQTSLMFLVGFLQSLLDKQPFTKMDEKNYAICFAPTVVRVPDDTPPQRIKAISEISISFMETLIARWDTSLMFPMKNEYLQ